jgi:hypothetical protein
MASNSAATLNAKYFQNRSLIILHPCLYDGQGRMMCLSRETTRTKTMSVSSRVETTQGVIAALLSLPLAAGLTGLALLMAGSVV